MRNEDGQRVVSGRELHRVLGVQKDFTGWVKNQLKIIEAVENIEYIIVWHDSFKGTVNFNGNVNSMTRNGYSMDYVLTLNTAKEICLLTLSSNRNKKQTKQRANEIRNHLTEVTGEGVPFTLKTRKELEFLDKLEQVLQPFKIQSERQYCIKTYRIDCYISSLNIAIEYDENNHQNYTYESHEGRQKEIEKSLGCRFIRVSDNYSDEYNIGCVLKSLFNL